VGANGVPLRSTPSLHSVLGAMSTHNKSNLSLRRISAFTGIAALSSYNVAYWRTSSFGSPLIVPDLLADVLLTAVFVVPFAMLAMLWPPLRTALRSLALLSIVAVVVGEGMARSQEVVVLSKYGRDPGTELSIKRWPPFGNHAIYFLPGYGWGARD